MKRLVMLAAVCVISGCASMSPREIRPTPAEMTEMLETNQTALWERWSRTEPGGSATVWIDIVSAHHFTREFSLIAALQADGSWTVVELSEERSGLLAVEPRLTADKEHTLSIGESRRLNAILATPRLYAEPRYREDASAGPGAHVAIIAIRTPRRERIHMQIGRRRGLHAELVDLLFSD